MSRSVANTRVSALISGVETPMDLSYVELGAEKPIGEIQTYYENYIPLFEPGVIHGLSDEKITLINSHLSVSPWLAAYNKMMTAGNARAVTGVRGVTPFSTNGIYTPAPVPTLEDVVPGFKDHESTQLHPWIDDAIASYTQALLWHMTNDNAHRDNAVNILAAWGSTLTAVEGRNQITPAGVSGIEVAKLYCGWSVPIWCRAIDLLRRRNIDVSGFVNMLRDVVYPQLDWAGAGNPILSLADARLQLAVILKDGAMFQEAINYLNYRISGSFGMASDSQIQRRPTDYYYPTLPEVGGTFIAGHGIDTDDETAQWWFFDDASSAVWIDGLGKETGRDISHLIMGLAAIGNAFETAYYSGVDLYALHQARIVKALELHASWTREAIRYRVDNSLTDAQMESLGWRPTGRYGATGAPDLSGAPWQLKSSANWVWGGSAYRGGWETLFGHYYAKGVSLPNTKALLDGWTDGSSYLGLRSDPPRATLHMAYDQLTHGVVF